MEVPRDGGCCCTRSGLEEGVRGASGIGYVGSGWCGRILAAVGAVLELWRGRTACGTRGKQKSGRVLSAGLQHSVNHA